MIKLFNKRLFFIIFFVIFLIFYYLNSGNKLEREDTPLYSIDLSKKFTKVIDYQTKKHIKHYKCFVLLFELNSFEEKLGIFPVVFSPKYNPYTLTDEQFYSSLIIGKPHFLLNLYKDGELILKKEIYITARESSFGEIVDGKRISLGQVYGHFKPRTSACYDFIENSHYTIELINDTPLPQYQGVETFFSIRYIYNK
ncbi:hypothetical protein [Pasteurella canis]|uniref:hypothetical protein n=1 Tax=Pasteurella canis TaxID=753 RepID=UPI001CBAA2C1|nr:hypothetical protein [Pasteurella canis]UAX41411.1 hypothetical protein K7G89_001294 [Pasteurella canis]